MSLCKNSAPPQRGRYRVAKQAVRSLLLLSSLSSGLFPATTASLRGVHASEVPKDKDVNNSAAAMPDEGLQEQGGGGKKSAAATASTPFAATMNVPPALFGATSSGNKKFLPLSRRPTYTTQENTAGSRDAEGRSNPTTRTPSPKLPRKGQSEPQLGRAGTRTETSTPTRGRSGSRGKGGSRTSAGRRDRRSKTASERGLRGTNTVKMPPVDTTALTPEPLSQFVSKDGKELLLKSLGFDSPIPGASKAVKAEFERIAEGIMRNNLSSREAGMAHGNIAEASTATADASTSWGDSSLLFPLTSNTVFLKRLRAVYAKAFSQNWASCGDTTPEQDQIMKEVVIAVHFQNMISSYSKLLENDLLSGDLTSSAAPVVDPPSDEEEGDEVERGGAPGASPEVDRFSMRATTPKKMLKVLDSRSTYYNALQPGYASGIVIENALELSTSTHKIGYNLDRQPPTARGVLLSTEQKKQLLEQHQQEDGAGDAELDMLVQEQRTQTRWAEILLRSRDRSSSAPFKDILLMLQIVNSKDDEDKTSERTHLFRELYADWRVTEIVYALRVLRSIHGHQEEDERTSATQQAPAKDSFYVTVNLRAPDLLLDRDVFQKFRQMVTTIRSAASPTACSRSAGFLAVGDRVAVGTSRYSEPDQHDDHANANIFSASVLAHLSKFLVFEITEDFSIRDTFGNKHDEADQGTATSDRDARKNFVAVLAAWKELLPHVRWSLDDVLDVKGVQGGNFAAKSFNDLETIFHFLENEEEERMKQDHAGDEVVSEPLLKQYQHPSSKIFDILKIDMDYAKSLFFSHPSLGVPFFQWKKKLVETRFTSVPIEAFKKYNSNKNATTSVPVEDDDEAGRPRRPGCDDLPVLPNMQALTNQANGKQEAFDHAPDASKYMTFAEYKLLLKNFVRLVVHTFDFDQALVIELTLNPEDKNLQKAIEILNEIVLPEMDQEEWKARVTTAQLQWYQNALTIPAPEGKGGNKEEDKPQQDFYVPISHKFWKQMAKASQQGGESGPVAFRARDVLLANQIM
ncbi:unnamed protein product [Amoebophrya sp. A120]|nr:unnamed protein product [Amoebophrya sp. A120]|eukprot:GSA120T00010503001.1